MLIREAHTLSMCRHNNEGNPLTEHVQSLYWACADIQMGENPLTKTQYLTETQSETEVIDTLLLM